MALTKLIVFSSCFHAQVLVAIFLAGTEIDALLSNAATTKSLTTWTATIRVCLKATLTIKWIVTSGFISLALTATTSSGNGKYN